MDFIPALLLATLAGGLMGGGSLLFLTLWRKNKRAQKRKLKASPQATPIREEVPREKVPNKVEFEIVREKDQRTIIVKKGKIGKGLELKNWKKRSFYPDHIIKETQGKKTRYFVRWNAYLSESYDKDGKIIYNEALESQLMNDMEIQLGKAVGAAVGFVLEKPIIILLVLAMVFGIPIGLSYNDIFGWVPRTVVHWVPRA